MKKPVLFLAIIQILVFSSCSRMDLAGVTATKCQEAPEWYSSVTVDGAITVEVSMEEDVIEIVSDANVLPYVNVHEQRGALIVEYDDGARFSGRYETIVRIPASREIQSVRLMNSAVFRMDAPVRTGYPLRFEAGSWSQFDFASISADNVEISLSDASVFLAGMVSVNNADISCCDRSEVMMDGVIQSCNAFLEDGSSLSPLTDTYVDRFELEIDCFYGNLSDSSSASFHSDGSISGTLRDRSRIDYTGVAQNTVTELEGSEY